MFDRLFPLQELDPEPPQPKPLKATTATVVEIGEEDVYEVEAIREKRVRPRRKEYLVKWEGWPEDTNTWERASRIHPALVAAFEGNPLPQPKQPRHNRVRHRLRCVRGVARAARARCFQRRSSGAAACH